VITFWTRVLVAEDDLKILIVLTPSAPYRHGPQDRHWLEELAAPYYTFQDAGAKVTLASVSGGVAPIDPISESAAAQTDDTRRFLADAVARQALANTVTLAASIQLIRRGVLLRRIGSGV